jgi:FixJ family two-component response regulator
MGRDLVCVVDDDDSARGVIAEALRPLDLEVQVFVGAGALLQRTLKLRLAQPASCSVQHCVAPADWSCRPI